MGHPCLPGEYRPHGHYGPDYRRRLYHRDPRREGEHVRNILSGRQSDRIARLTVSGTDQPLVGTFKGYAYNGRICQRPGYDQYLHVGSTGRMAAVFELENKRIVRRKEIYNKLPEFELAPDGMNLSPSGENDLGFRFAVSENYIYLCPIPFKLKDLGVVKDYKGYPLGYADDLQIFDWNGNPVCRYELDTPVVSLTVAPDESHLYANTIDPETEEPRILRFALPSLEH